MRISERERNVNCMGNPCEVSGTSHKTEWLYSNPNPSKREKQGGTLPISIETHESREQENREVSLLLQQRTPIPRRGQTSIDARPRVEEIVSSGPVESVLEEIPEDLSAAPFGGPEFVFDVGPEGGFGHEFGDFGDGVADGEEDAVNLGVLV